MKESGPDWLKSIKPGKTRLYLKFRNEDFFWYWTLYWQSSQLLQSQNDINVKYLETSLIPGRGDSHHHHHSIRQRTKNLWWNRCVSM